MEALGNSKFQKAIMHECKKFRNKTMGNESKGLEKIKSIETKMNEDENSTESFIEHKKDSTLKLPDFNECPDPIPESIAV